MQQGTETLTEQEVKTVESDSSFPQVSMVTSDGQNDSNASEFSAYLPIFFEEKDSSFFFYILLTCDETSVDFF